MKILLSANNSSGNKRFLLQFKDVIIIGWIKFRFITFCSFLLIEFAAQFVIIMKNTTNNAH